MIVIRIHYGKLPLFVNFGCHTYVFMFAKFLEEYGWKYDIMKSCPIETIDQTAESIKTEIMGMFWNWMNQFKEGA